MTAIGDGIARLDGPEKVTGRAQYAADFHLEGQAHAVLVGASVPSGRLKAVDTSRAEDVPGLLRVLAAGDFPVPAERFGDFPVPPLATRHLPLQDEVIVYHGQPVAMIVAETLEAAEEAAADVRVEIQIEPSANPERAQPAPPQPEGYAALGSVDVNVGDIDAAVRNSPVVVTGTYVQPSRHNNPMEPSAILAVWEDDRLTIYDSVQHVFAVQAALAAVFDIETGDVRVVSPYTGGGFGAKAYVWPHEILAAMAARILDKPIKLVLTRAQMYSIVGYQPWMTQEVTLAAEANGTLTGIRHDVTNITAKTDDYVEFGSATSSALYRSPAISTLSARSPRPREPSNVYAIADRRPGNVGPRVGDGRTRARDPDRSPRSASPQLCRPRAGHRQAMVVQETSGGVRRRRPPIRLAGPSPRRLTRWQLVGWVRVGRRNPGAISLPLASSTHA